MNTPVDISNIVLKTERLILRPWRRSRSSPPTL